MPGEHVSAGSRRHEGEAGGLERFRKIFEPPISDLFISSHSYGSIV